MFEGYARLDRRQTSQQSDSCECISGPVSTTGKYNNKERFGKRNIRGSTRERVHKRARQREEIETPYAELKNAEEHMSDADSTSCGRWDE